MKDFKLKTIVDGLLSLDGVAVANIDEPSKGDLARVLKQNSELRKELKLSQDLNEHLCKGVSILYPSVNLDDAMITSITTWLEEGKKFLE